MRTAIIAAALSLASVGIASAQDATTTPRPAFTFADVMRTCGAEWRESEQRKATPGLAAWNVYRAECLQRKGFASKAKAAPKDFVRVPDKT
jgi:hypothetical protein